VKWANTKVPKRGARVCPGFANNDAVPKTKAETDSLRS